MAATVPKVPYRPDGETSERTLVRGGHPHTGDFSPPVLATRRCNFPTRGGSGDKWCRRDASNRPPPTAGSWLQSYEFLTLGPGAISHGRGEEKPKGTEQLELLQGDGVAGAATRSDRGDLARRCPPGAASRSKQGFFLAVSLI